MVLLNLGRCMSLTCKTQDSVCDLSVLHRGVAKARVMAYFGEGTGPIHVDNVKCSGEEGSLAECFKQPPGTHNCRHSEDAGVICDYGRLQPGSKEVKGLFVPGFNDFLVWLNAALSRWIATSVFSKHVRCVICTEKEWPTKERIPSRIIISENLSRCYECVCVGRCLNRSCFYFCLSHIIAASRFAIC